MFSSLKSFEFHVFPLKFLWGKYFCVFWQFHFFFNSFHFSTEVNVIDSWHFFWLWHSSKMKKSLISIWSVCLVGHITHFCWLLIWLSFQIMWHKKNYYISHFLHSVDSQDQNPKPRFLENTMTDLICLIFKGTTNLMLCNLLGIIFF